MDVKSDLLMGRRRLTFINGSYQLCTIIDVVWDMGGHPILLVDDNECSYPWVSIRKIGPRQTEDGIVFI